LLTVRVSPRRSLGLAVVAASVAAAPRSAEAAQPTNDEQLMLEMLNRMRWDPAAELNILVNLNPTSPATWGTPKSNDPGVASALTFFNVDAAALAAQWAGLAPRTAPLAWNSNLNNAAAGHNAAMIAADQQTHQAPGEPTLGTRLTNAGYIYTAGAENVYAYATSIFYGHAGFAIDWGPGPGGMQSPPGHRDTMMNAGLREVGISITPESNPGTGVGPLVITQDFGSRSGSAFFTGVIYSDPGNYFYAPGKGLSGVTVRAFNAGTSTLRASTTTFGSGGYTLQAPAGTYDVTFSGGALLGRTITYRNVTIGSSNVKLDSLSSFIAGSGSSWNSVQNWSAGLPDGPGTTAVLGRTIPGQSPGPRTVTVTAPVTVGQLVLDGANPVNLGGSGAVTFAGGGTTPASITAKPVAGAGHTLSAPLSFTGQVVRDGTGTLTIDGVQQHQAGATLSVRDGTTSLLTNAGRPGVRPLNVGADGAMTRLNLQASQDLARLDVTGGARVTLTPGGAKILVAEGLTVPTGTFDLTDNAALVDYASPSDPAPADVAAAVKRGYAGGTWAGGAITSSAAAANHRAAVGYARATEIFDPADATPTFFGRDVDATSLLLRFTLQGDADLDGSVTFADFERMRGRLTETGDWAEGDFDYDGRVTARDYALLRRNFGMSLGGSAAGVTAAQWAVIESFAAAVPEPGTIAPGVAAAALVALRRRPGR
jgi:uncharacterized protein YkwD